MSRVSGCGYLGYLSIEIDSPGAANVRILSVMVNDALRLLLKPLGGLILLVVDNEVAILIKLSSLLIKSMRYLMTYHGADGSVVEIFRTVLVKEDILENSRRKTDQVMTVTVYR